MTDSRNTTKSNHTKILGLSNFFTAISAAIRPITAPITDHKPSQRLYYRSKLPAVALMTVELIAPHRTRYIPVAPATLGSTPIESRAGL